MARPLIENKRNISAHRKSNPYALPAMSITITQLRSFLAVIGNGSVTGAADELYVTQPSVSAAVAALSREIGSELLERDGRGVRPTPAGSSFAPYASHVIGLLEQGARAAREAADAAQRSVHIAAVTTAAESFVPGLMRAYSDAHPEVALVLSVANRAAVIDLVAEHRADVAFAGRPPQDERIQASALRANELVLLAAPDDPRSSGPPLHPEDLAGDTWLLREPGSGTRAANEEFLLRHQLGSRTLTMGSNGAIRQATRAGLGISFVSREAVSVELEAGLLSTLPIAQAPESRAWHLLRSARGPSRPVVDDFVVFLLSGEAAGEDRGVA
jgi:DNA-binding transcriptional LysR family regulator